MSRVYPWDRRKTLQERLRDTYGEEVATPVPTTPFDELVERLSKSLETKMDTWAMPRVKHKTRRRIFSRVPGVPLACESQWERKARMELARRGRKPRHYNTKRKQSRGTTRRYRARGRDIDKLKRSSYKSNPKSYYLHLVRAYGNRFKVEESFWIEVVVPKLEAFIREEGIQLKEDSDLSKYFAFLRKDRREAYSNSNLEIFSKQSQKQVL